MPHSPVIAFLGAGTMGRPMAANLRSAGFPVRVWNRTRSRAEPLAELGATVADSAAQAADGADVLITMLTDTSAVASAVDGALDQLADGAIWIQMSTVGVEGHDRLAALAQQRGVAFVDAPVLGTRKPAEDGTLKILVSGPDAARARVADVLAAMGSVLPGLGDAGEGSRLKLVANAWILSLTDAVASSIALARRLDLDPRLFLDAIGGSASDSAYAHVKGGAILSGDYTPSFTLAGAAKDAGLIFDAADAVGYDAALVATVRRHLQTAVDRGHGDEDMAAIYFAHEPNG